MLANVHYLRQEYHHASKHLERACPLMELLPVSAFAAPDGMEGSAQSCFQFLRDVYTKAAEQDEDLGILEGSCESCSWDDDEEYDAALSINRANNVEERLEEIRRPLVSLREELFNKDLNSDDNSYNSFEDGDDVIVITDTYSDSFSDDLCDLMSADSSSIHHNGGGHCSDNSRNIDEEAYILRDFGRYPADYLDSDLVKSLNALVASAVFEDEEGRYRLAEEAQKLLEQHTV